MSYPRPLHWWVDNVLPLVYDGSLSYYEVMSKVTEYINGLTGDMTEVKSQIENINAVIETIEPERIETLLTEVDRLATAVSGMEGRVGTLEADNVTNKSDISNLKSSVNLLEGGVSALETNVQNIGERLGNVEEDVGGYSERIENAENLARTASANTAALGERVDAAEQKVDNVEDKADNYSKAIAQSEEWYTATRNYQTHDLLFVGSTLYEVIRNITNGDPLVIGNNIKAVTISENNKEIKGDVSRIADAEEDLEDRVAGIDSVINYLRIQTDNLDEEVNGILNNRIVVSGSAPTISGVSGKRYVCGEVTTLNVAAPSGGIIDVTFRSGSTPTVLNVTITGGGTLKWANGFSPAALEANTTYEINIMDGLGVAVSWT